MRYSGYGPEDFALDEDFQQWVLNPTPQRDRFWQEWLQYHPEQRKVITEAIELVQLAGLSKDHAANADFLEVWEQLRINAEQSAHRPFWAKPAFRYAAAVIGILVATAGWLWYRGESSSTTQYATGYGETKLILLPDGSQVTLNAQSSLQLLGEKWGQGKTREVLLTGEAFFEIQKTKDRKRFIVRTANQEAVQVLGTEFNVNTRRARTAVYLQSGKVKFTAPTGEATLQPGELAEFNQQNKKLKVGPATESTWLAWRDNMFVFDDAPLTVVAQAIEDYYGLKVIFSSESLAQQRFTGKIPREDIDVLLNVLSETLKIIVTKRKQEVLIQPR